MAWCFATPTPGLVGQIETSAVGDCFAFVCLFPIHTAQTFTMGPIVKLLLPLCHADYFLWEKTYGFLH